MTNAFDTSSKQGLMDFCRHHRPATLLLNSMTSDYAASRCLLILGHFPGLVLGAQAIEKILKSYLLFHNPELKVRGLGHSLPNILQKAATIFPQMDLRRFLPLVNRFKEHYQARYPDNPDASSSMTTGELIELERREI